MKHSLPCYLLLISCLILAPAAAFAIDKEVLEEVVKGIAEDIFTPANAATPSDGEAALPATNERASLPAGFTPSYGKWEASIMFSKADIDNMKSLLNVVEQQRGQAAPMYASVEDKEAMERIISASEESEKEIIYPSFRLQSLLYYSPERWYMRLNNAAYSSETETSGGEFEILDIGEETVELLWTPPDPILFSAIVKDQRLRNGGGAPISVNRVAADGEEPVININARSIFFSLRTNQVFDSKSFVIYEGDIPGLVTTSAISQNTVRVAERGMDPNRQNMLAVTKDKDIELLIDSLEGGVEEMKENVQTMLP